MAVVLSAATVNSRHAPLLQHLTEFDTVRAKLSTAAARERQVERTPRQDVSCNICAVF
jgi:hypothetical protein